MELVVTKNFGNPESWTLESYRARRVGTRP